MYLAKVIQANNVIPHPNADRLSILEYGGVQYVIGNDISIGDKVVIFPGDGQLSDEFCKTNNLYREPSKNLDETKKGFFEDNRRVRTQPFRGVKSYGLVVRLDAFGYLGDFDPEIGFEFSEWNGKEVCQKYYTPATLRAMKTTSGGKKVKFVDYNLKEHYDTQKLEISGPKTIERNTLMIITEKVHGTSARTGNVKVDRLKQNFLQRILSRLFNRQFGKTVTNYELVSGTRRTIINSRPDIFVPGNSDYYRAQWHEKIAPQLHKGETVYYEIAGYENTGKPIMETQDMQRIKHRKEGFGCDNWSNTMVYSYGCEKGMNKVFVYRITQDGPDGNTIELSWNQVESRAKELGLDTVPVLVFKRIKFPCHINSEVSKILVDKSSTIDQSHLMEGVCVRLETPSRTVVYKQKNFLFGVLEGYLKERDDYVDVEEVN